MQGVEDNSKFMDTHRIKQKLTMKNICPKRTEIFHFLLDCVAMCIDMRMFIDKQMLNRVSHSTIDIF